MGVFTFHKFLYTMLNGLFKVIIEFSGYHCNSTFYGFIQSVLANFYIIARQNTPVAHFYHSENQQYDENKKRRHL